MKKSIIVQYGSSIKEIEPPDPFNPTLFCNWLMSSFSIHEKEIFGLRYPDTESVIPIDDQLDVNALFLLGSSHVTPLVMVFYSMNCLSPVKNRSIDK